RTDPWYRRRYPRATAWPSISARMGGADWPMRTIMLAALSVVAGTVVACSDSSIGAPSSSANSPTKLVVLPAFDTTGAGDTVRFTSLRDSVGTTVQDSGPVSWTVSDSRVAII